MLMLAIVVSSARATKFGYLILFFEYFYVLGLGVYPVVASLGLVGSNPMYADYERHRGGLNGATYLHIALFAIGSAAGYFGFNPGASALARVLARSARRTKFDNQVWFSFCLATTVGASGLYFYLVGIDVALLNTYAVRGGDFSGLAGLEQYSFLKTVSMLGLFAVIALPYYFSRSSSLASSFIAIVCVSVLIFAQTGARVTFADTVLLYFVLLFIVRKQYSAKLIASLTTTVTLSICVLIYGKEFMGVLSSYLFLDSDLDLSIKYDDFATYFFSHFGHLVYSIDAGIRHFWERGPLLAVDIIVSPLGFLPSFVFASAGAESLSYQLLEQSDRLSCINAAHFALADECSIPPYIAGFAAYVIPMAGALLFGFLRFFVYRIAEIAWMRLRESPEHLWAVLMALLIANRIFLFIPNTISFAVFTLICLGVFIPLSRLFQNTSLASSQ
jgi:hypothetical protein